MYQSKILDDVSLPMMSVILKAYKRCILSPNLFTLRPEAIEPFYHALGPMCLNKGRQNDNYGQKPSEQI